MKLSRTFLVALTVVGLVVFADRVASAPASPGGLNAADWSSLQQLLPTISQQAYLKASDTGRSDHFGYAVSLSGDTVVIGLPYKFGLGPGDVLANPGSWHAGAVYVFVRNGTNWSQEARLQASNARSNDWFGYSVSVSGDTLVVGAHRESSNATGVNGDQTDTSAPYSGAAYVFVRSGTNWTQQAYLKASNPQGAPPGNYYDGDMFGVSVAVSGDTVVVGAFWEDGGAAGVNGDQSSNSAVQSGAAYVFVRSGTTWTQQAYLKAFNPGVGDEFGTSVSISGDAIVVGAPGEDSSATGVNGDPTNNGALNSGAAYIFMRAGTTWTQQAYLKASNPGGGILERGSFIVPGDDFGRSVSIFGNTAVVGAPLEGSNATGVNGDQTNNNAFESGAAYVFVGDGANWTQQAYLKASNPDGGRPADPAFPVLIPTPGDLFGYSVGLSGDTIVVGALHEDSNATGVNGNQGDNSTASAGAAYVFIRNGANWTQQAYLKASNAGWSDAFGISVAVSGDTIVSGAIGESSNATGVNGDPSNDDVRESGAAYVFAGAGPSRDADGDGVPDPGDQCPNTLAGTAVDGNGCSIPQLVPCDGPWRNHGEYIHALGDVADRFLQGGLISVEEWHAILVQGTKSGCGQRPGPK